MSRLSGFKNPKIPPLRHLQCLRWEIWSPLPIHKQLCWHKEPQCVPFLHSIAWVAHTGSHFLKHNPSCGPLLKRRTELSTSRILLQGPVLKLDSWIYCQYSAVGILESVCFTFCRVLGNDYSEEFLQREDYLRNVLKTSPFHVYDFSIRFYRHAKSFGSPEHWIGY